MYGLQLRTFPAVNQIRVSDGQTNYCFHALQVSETNDTPIEDVDKPVVYVGENKGSLHYVNGKNLDNVPSDVLDKISDNGYTIVDNVEGGWASWEGRPEWSEPYIDLSDATVVE